MVRDRKSYEWVPKFIKKHCAIIFSVQGEVNIGAFFCLETVVSVGAVGVSTYFFCSINNCRFPFLAGCGEVGK